MGVFDLSIVTSVSGRYGIYLGEWAASIVAQTVRPAHVGILANGPGLERSVEAAREVISAAGIPCTVRHLARQCDFGRARNLAVAMSDTTWVMHFDVDDVLLPHAVADVAEIAPSADVVCLGYERFGGENTGPAAKLYRSSRGMSTLTSVSPASGLSPFRRSFWLRSPYIEDGLEGGWDTALWLGFAHLDARFVPTRRHCFRYRQHADSVFASRVRDKAKSQRVGRRFEQLRWGRDVTVCVPYRPDGGARDRSWAWVREWWAHHFPGWQLVSADSGGLVWNKPQAVNRCVAEADGRTLVVADSDVFCDPLMVLRAVRHVWADRTWVMPQGRVFRLDERETGRVLAGSFDPSPNSRATIRSPYQCYPAGGIFVVAADAWRDAGGHDERFEGWGAEDEALARKLDTLVGRCKRLGAPLWHLWHPPGPRFEDPNYPANRSLHQQYKRAAGSRAAMLALVARQRRGEEAVAR